jgi:hypothetical protein
MSLETLHQCLKGHTSTKGLPLPCYVGLGIQIFTSVKEILMWDFLLFKCVCELFRYLNIFQAKQNKAVGWTDFAPVL